MSDLSIQQYKFTIIGMRKRRKGEKGLPTSIKHTKRYLNTKILLDQAEIRLANYIYLLQRGYNLKWKIYSLSEEGNHFALFSQFSKHVAGVPSLKVCVEVKQPSELIDWIFLISSLIY